MDVVYGSLNVSVAVPVAVAAAFSGEVSVGEVGSCLRRLACMSVLSLASD